MQNRIRMPMFTATTPHFFKVILPDARNHKLQIPEAFATRHGELLGQHIFVKVPTGDKWVITLKKRGGSIWLQEGWALFAKFYHISPGYFLVFRHEANSHFHVIIFDTSASEIDYPLLVPQTKKSDVSDMEDSNSDAHSDSSATHPEEEKMNRFGPSLSDFMIRQKALPIKALERRRAIERASDFESVNPFCVVIMQNTYLVSSYVNLPKEFAIKHLGKGRMDLTLRSYDGRAWDLRYVGSPMPRFSMGWMQFLEDNNLKRGDVCRFEFTRDNVSPVTVVIFSADEDV